MLLLRCLDRHASWRSTCVSGGEALPSHPHRMRRGKCRALRTAWLSFLHGRAKRREFRDIGIFVEMRRYCKPHEAAEGKRRGKTRFMPCGAGPLGNAGDSSACRAEFGVTRGQKRDAASVKGKKKRPLGPLCCFCAKLLIRRACCRGAPTFRGCARTCPSGRAGNTTWRGARPPYA